MTDVVTDHEPGVEASAWRTGEPHGDVVGALDEVPAGSRVSMDTVRQALVLADGHHICAGGYGRVHILRLQYMVENDEGCVNINLSNNNRMIIFSNYELVIALQFRWHRIEEFISLTVLEKMHILWYSFCSFGNN